MFSHQKDTHNTKKAERKRFFASKPSSEIAQKQELPGQRQLTSRTGRTFSATEMLAGDGTTEAIQPQLIQTKLAIGEVGDKYEREADRVAKETVQQLRQPLQKDKDAPPVQQRPISPYKLQRREDLQGGEVSTELETQINRSKSGGQSLAPDLQGKMGRAMGTDFSDVKVHTDSHADRLNQSLQAKAFTTGNHIFFKKGEYSPNSTRGQELLAHELTHVVQQNGRAVQCKNENTIVQKDEVDKKREKSAAVKLLLPLLNSSPTIKKKGLRIDLKDFIDFDKKGVKIPIKDISLFKAMSWFANKEYSTENTNSILMMRALNIYSVEQMMAVIEQFCQRIQTYKYKKHLPQVSYYFGGSPEDINVPAQIMTKMVDNYTKVDNVFYNENGTKRPNKEIWTSENSRLFTDMQMATLQDFESVKFAISRRLVDTMYRFKTDPEITKALSIITSLKSIRGGAMKARILSGYNDSSFDYPETRKRR